METEKKKLRLGVGSGIAAIVLASGLAIGIPAIAQASSPGPTSVGFEDGTNDGEIADDDNVQFEDGTNDGETADDQGVEDGTNDGETADDQEIEDGTDDGETADD
ncbi:hypothetical protein [Microbacterium terricola]|uniref:hypothetical protein n=1 Tax=Microbacterium terricola TaxID=344163 RepID=UPI0021E6F8F0|nr:hypothetical protein [Microbacterium terricola]UYK40655.1 hypothetical protein OAU46_03100 [Microbacterium terricola]